MAEVAIYGLFDPRSGELRYIGKANDPSKRLEGHLRERRRRSPLYDWIGSLRASSVVPEMRVLHWCPTDGWQNFERAFIAEARGQGFRLLNLADGGDEPECSTEVRRNNALRTNKVRPPHVMRAYRMLENHIRVAAKHWPQNVAKMRHAKEVLRAAVERHRAAGTLEWFDERLRLRFFDDKPKAARS